MMILMSKFTENCFSNNDNRILPATPQFGLNTFRPWLLCERGEGDQSFPLLLFLAFLALASKLSSLYPRGANGMSTRDWWLALEKITQLWLPLPSWDPFSSETSVVELVVTLKNRVEGFFSASFWGVLRLCSSKIKDFGIFDWTFFVWTHIVQNPIWLKKNLSQLDNEGKFNSFLMSRIWIHSQKSIS